MGMHRVALHGSHLLASSRLLRRHMSMEPQAAVTRLKESGLLKTQGLVGGKWIDSYDGKTIEVTNPATGDVVANVACMSGRETSDAISSAYNSFSWSKISYLGEKGSLGMTFYEPTVLGNVNSEMLVAREEVFGPVAPLLPFKTEEEAIHLANDTNAGLAAYIFTTSIPRSWRVSEALEYGLVGVNEGLISLRSYSSVLRSPSCCKLRKLLQ